MKQSKDDKQEERTSQSYELIIRRNAEKAREQEGAPHLILRRNISQGDEQNGFTFLENKMTEEPDANHQQPAPPEVESTERIADYISSLMHHVPDDVARVVDAIIEEEGKLPTNLPKLDDQLALIYPGSDVRERPGDLESPAHEGSPSENSVQEENKAQKYTKKVEYEDL